jgi:hypothetical protein
MDHLHWQHLLAKLLVTATVTLGSATSVFSCLGCLGQFDGQGKYIQHDIMGVIVCDIALNIANVNSAYWLRQVMKVISRGNSGANKTH